MAISLLSPCATSGSPITAIRTATRLSKWPLTQYPRVAIKKAPATAGIREPPTEPVPSDEAATQARKTPSNGVRPQMTSLVTGIRWSGYLVWLTSWFTTRIESATTTPQAGCPVWAKASRPAAAAGAIPSATRSSRRRAVRTRRLRAGGGSSVLGGTGASRGRSCRAASNEFSWYEVTFISLGGPCTWFQVPLPAYEDLLRR